MDKFCPLTGDPCAEHQCEWYIQLLGTHPQSGEVINEYGCTMRWMPILLIENSKQQRETGAAVESFRNEMVHQNMDTIGKIMTGQAPKQLEKN